MTAPREIDFLLIGGGIAAANCARTLREEGAAGSILLVGREKDPPYHRPPATKTYLEGRSSREDALVWPAGWWEENDVELLTQTSVMGLDLEARVAKLQSKDEIRFGRALVATGAMVRRLNAEGASLDGIHYLRALANVDALRRDLEHAERVVVVGGSYLGCEVAASLTALGHECAIVMQEEVTLERGFGACAGRFFQSALEERGIEVVGGEEVERFEGDGERLRAVLTRSGRQLSADAVVAGVGASPDVTLARRSGLELGELGGVRTTAQLESSTPGVYAAGDMCEYRSVVHDRAIRIEHEHVAFAQGATAARNMLGRGLAHEEVPYFFSDLSDWVSLEYVGPARAWDEEVVRGSLADGEFSLWYLEGGRVRAALSVGRGQDLDHARRLIASGADLAARRPELADLGSDLALLGA